MSSQPYWLFGGTSNHFAGSRLLTRVLRPPHGPRGPGEPDPLQTTTHAVHDGCHGTAVRSKTGNQAQTEAETDGRSYRACFPIPSRPPPPRMRGICVSDTCSRCQVKGQAPVFREPFERSPNVGKANVVYGTDGGPDAYWHRHSVTMFEGPNDAPWQWLQMK